MKKQIVHFLHIGKTGGSAIKSVLEQNHELKDYKLILHGHDTALTDIEVGEKFFFFLRDPISRFISGFYSRKRKGVPRYYSEWSILEEKIFKTFSTPNELALALGKKDTLEKHMLAVEAMYGIEHLKHYSKWYGDFEYFNSRLNDVFFIGFQESLDNDFKELIDILGISESAHLPKDEVGAHRNPLSIDKRLDDFSIDVLQEWYAEDYEFIQLCNELKTTHMIR